MIKTLSFLIGILGMLLIPLRCEAVVPVYSSAKSVASVNRWINPGAARVTTTYTRGYVATVQGKSTAQREAENKAAWIREGFTEQAAAKYSKSGDFYTNNRTGLSYVKYSTQIASSNPASSSKKVSQVTPVPPAPQPTTSGKKSSKAKEEPRQAQSLPAQPPQSSPASPPRPNPPSPSPSVPVQPDIKPQWNIQIIPLDSLHVTDYFDPEGENFRVIVECTVPFDRLAMEFCGYSLDFGGKGRLLLSRELEPTSRVEFVQNVHYQWPVDDAPITVCAWTTEGDVGSSRIFVDVVAFNPYLTR